MGLKIKMPKMPKMPKPPKMPKMPKPKDILGNKRVQDALIDVAIRTAQGALVASAADAGTADAGDAGKAGG